MTPSLHTQSTMDYRVNYSAARGSRPTDQLGANFDLRDTLAATVVRDLSYAEFRAALAQSGKRNA